MGHPELHLAADAEAGLWHIVRTGYDATQEAAQESLFALANGVLGTRGGIEERRSDSTGTYLACGYDQFPITYHERFPGFAKQTDTRLPVAEALAIDIHCLATDEDLGSAVIMHHTRALDLRSGVLTRTTRWRTAAGADITVQAERLVPFAHPHVIAVRLRITSHDYVGRLRIASHLDGSGEAAAQSHDPRFGAGEGVGLDIIHVEADRDHATMVQQARHRPWQVAAVQRHSMSAQTSAVWSAVTATTRASQHLDVAITPGTDIVLEKYIGYDWGLPSIPASLAGQATARVDAARAMGFDALVAQQKAQLQEFWRAAQIDIAGAEHLTLALRFNMFHLFQSASRDGTTSIAAKGLTGQGYEGHCFWDTEAYLLPVLALTAPTLARHVLEYRYNVLDRARAHARALNHQVGALYPWRTIAGDECSAYFPSGSAQYHINAAIAFAIQVYVNASGDFDFISRHGAEMLCEMARLWLAVGHFNPRRKGAFCIHEITGPDEYSALVNNNFYTNLMVQEQLRYTLHCLERLRREAPADHARIIAKLDLRPDEVEQWRRAADTMYLPYDAALHIHPQDDDFLDKPRWDFAATPPEHYPLLLHYHPLTIYRFQVCKQADVLLAMLFAGHRFDRGAKLRNFQYYEPLTTHDSTLSAPIFSSLAARIGEGAKALDYFAETAVIDLENRHGNTHHGVHMAAMAGSWLALLWGFAGLQPLTATPEFAPICPAAWRQYDFSLRWQGRTLHVRVTPGQTCYRLTEGQPLEIIHHGRRHQLREGLDLPNRPIVAGTIAAVIFDLDGVLTDTARAHYRAWKAIADEIAVPFDEQINERLKGVDRAASLDIILEQATRPYDDQEKQALMARKNSLYQNEIMHFGPQHLFAGCAAFLHDLRQAGVRIGLASASRNAATLIDRLGIASCFDHITDAATIANPKPHPEIFLATAKALGVSPGACLGIEDAAAGIAAIKAAGMTAIGIGDPQTLTDADMHLADLTRFPTHLFDWATTAQSTPPGAGRAPLP